MPTRTAKPDWYKRKRSQLRAQLARLDRAIEIEETYVPIPGRADQLRREVARVEGELAELDARLAEEVGD